MGDLQALHAEAEQHGIYTAYCPLGRDTPAMLVSTGGQFGIGLNTEYIKTIADEKYILAHELGHYHTGTYYTFESPLLVRDRAEYAADTWMVKRLIPIQELYAAFSQGYTETWELAEYFNLPEHVIRRAAYIYKCKALL